MGSKLSKEIVLKIPLMYLYDMKILHRRIINIFEMGEIEFHKALRMGLDVKPRTKYHLKTVNDIIINTELIPAYKGLGDRWMNEVIKCLHKIGFKSWPHSTVWEEVEFPYTLPVFDTDSPSKVIPTMLCIFCKLKRTISIHEPEISSCGLSEPESDYFFLKDGNLCIHIDGEDRIYIDLAYCPFCSDIIRES